MNVLLSFFIVECRQIIHILLISLSLFLLLDFSSGNKWEKCINFICVFSFYSCGVLRISFSGCLAHHSTLKNPIIAGSHPRMGALDVCPFIPVSGVSVPECVQVSREFGRRLAQELGVPVYLYGDAAEKGDYRVTMPQIRAGEYEGLKEKVRVYRFSCTENNN